MINFVASANTTSAAASTMVVTLPTHSEGDVIILSFVHDYNSDTQQLTSVSEGYTQLVTLNVAGLNHQGAVWYKKAGASETNPTATYSASSQEMACLASSYSGVDTSVQIDVGPSLWATEDPGDTTVIAPSVTTTLNGAMLINVATADENNTFTQPSGMTLVDNLVFSNMVVSSAYQEIATAGATGGKTWTFSENTDEITAVAFALRPIVAAGVTITATESYTDFSESIGVDVVPAVNVTSAITESYSSFTESVNVDVAANISSVITESYNDFSELINTTVAADVQISAIITESYSSFTEGVVANVAVDIASAITESYEDFSETISVSISKDVALSVTESYDYFTESITASFPIIITVNPKNIVRVKRKNNSVIIKRKSNIVRVR